MDDAPGMTEGKLVYGAEPLMEGAVAETEVEAEAEAGIE